MNRSGLFLVTEAGFEPRDLKIMSLASYRTAPLRDVFMLFSYIERPARIELASPAWKAGAQPLDHDRTYFIIAHYLPDSSEGWNHETYASSKQVYIDNMFFLYSLSIGIQ